MKIIKTRFKGLKIIKHNTFYDKRGFLRITHNQKKLNKKFIFEYCTTSKKNSLRGFHFQYKFPQAKYVTVLKGKILDCVIDLRKKSKTFGKIFKITLSQKNNLALFIPEGFAHAYYSYEKENIIYYKLSNYYRPKFEDGILTTDKNFINIWPKTRKIISPKDKKLKTFEKFKSAYKSL
jgi:dTDP-4-dehydrorhamnose 3,5-epimerase